MVHFFSWSYLSLIVFLINLLTLKKLVFQKNFNNRILCKGDWLHVDFCENFVFDTILGIKSLFKTLILSLIWFQNQFTPHPLLVCEFHHFFQFAFGVYLCDNIFFIELDSSEFFLTNLFFCSLNNTLET